MSPDPINPFQFLMGDLMNMLGNSAPDPWETTKAFGVNVATEGNAEIPVDPLDRIRLEELARVAELHVVEICGMPVSSDGHRVTCVPVGRGDWTARALMAWKPTLSAMTPPTVPEIATDPGQSLDESDPSAGLNDMIAKWAVAIGPMFFGLQLGSVVGHLSHRTLGQYALAIPWSPSDELIIVTANVKAFADDWSIPEDEAILWVCARELAAHAVLARPSVRHRMNELLAELATSAATSQQGLIEKLGGEMDLESLQGMFGDPEALLGDFLTPGTQRISDQLTALAVVIDAYADHVASQAGVKLVGSHALLDEAWYRRRIERGKGEEAAGALFGLDLSPSQVDRGRAFIAGVVERAGDEGLARLWVDQRNLPTPSEVDAPGLWLERISLPELGSTD